MKNGYFGSIFLILLFVLLINVICINVVSNDANEYEEIVYITPDQSEDFTIYAGMSTFEGDLTELDSDETTFYADGPTSKPDEYLHNITYKFGTLQWGDINRTRERDNQYMRINSEPHNLLPSLECVTLELNFDPPLAGRDFYVDIRIWSPDSSYGASTALFWKNSGWKDEDLLYSNIPGNFMDLLNFYVEDVEKLIIHIDCNGQGPFYVYFDYMKIREVGSDPAELNFTCTTQIPIESLDGTLKETALEYAYITNISTPTTLSLWNYQSSSWNQIDTDYHIDYNKFTYVLNNTFLNNTHFISLNFFLINDTNAYKLLIDLLTIKLTLLITEETTMPEGEISGYDTIFISGMIIFISIIIIRKRYKSLGLN